MSDLDFWLDYDPDAHGWGGGAAAALTVEQFTRHLSAVLSQDEILQDLWVRGEMSNVTRASSGHLYFSLKDGSATLSCVMFRSAAMFLQFRPEAGIQVLARGAVGVYAPRGQYQLDVLELQPDGVGALHLALEQTKARLRAEGLLDAERKRPLPAFPETVAVITSPSGAAVRDFCVTLERCSVPPRVVVVPALVQGPGAEESLAAALALANRHSGADVILLGRGGGSMEDLWAFNSETVARAIAASRIPIVSAVGHETDFTLADMVADARAATPTAGAEWVVDCREEMLCRLAAAGAQAASALRARLETAELRLHGLCRRSPLARPQWLVESRRQRLDDLNGRLARLREGLLSRARHRLALAAGRLESVSPLGTLARGYARVTRAPEGAPVTSIRGVAAGDHVRVALVDGSFEAEVTGVSERGE